jgi:hypothetical protein
VIADAILPHDPMLHQVRKQIQRGCSAGCEQNVASEDSKINAAKQYEPTATSGPQLYTEARRTSQESSKRAVNALVHVSQMPNVGQIPVSPVHWRDPVYTEHRRGLLATETLLAG